MDDSGLMYIVSGTGNTCCTKDDNIADVPVEYMQWYISDRQKGQTVTGGFTSITATDHELVFRFFDQSGAELFVSPGVKPRPSSSSIPSVQVYIY